MKRIDRIESKVDLIDSRLGSIDSTLVAQHASLREHIRRTELLEMDVHPIKRHVAMIEGCLKLIGLMATIATVAGVLIEVARFVKGM